MKSGKFKITAHHVTTADGDNGVILECDDLDAVTVGKLLVKLASDDEGVPNVGQVFAICGMTKFFIHAYRDRIVIDTDYDIDDVIEERRGKSWKGDSPCSDYDSSLIVDAVLSAIEGS